MEFFGNYINIPIPCHNTIGVFVQQTCPSVVKIKAINVSFIILK